jgi:hypothetical protein
LDALKQSIPAARPGSIMPLFQSEQDKNLRLPRVQKGAVARD